MTLATCCRAVIFWTAYAQYIVTARKRKPPVGNKTLEWKVAKELQVGYRRCRKAVRKAAALMRAGV